MIRFQKMTMETDSDKIVLAANMTAANVRFSSFTVDSGVIRFYERPALRALY